MEKISSGLLSQKIGKPNKLKVFVSKKTKGITKGSKQDN
jgi:hypothetical protein